MEHFVDISDDAFEALQNHTSQIISLPFDLVQSFVAGDSMKLYHPSNEMEALRVQIDKMEKNEENNAEMILHCSLLEWIFQMETELDDPSYFF